MIAICLVVESLRESGQALRCNIVVEVEVAMLLLAKKKCRRRLVIGMEGQTGMNWR
jgi:hypothetical protein